jgi:hypothetical protein
MGNNRDNRYEIKGHFYSRKISGIEESLRSVLEIKRANSTPLAPDIIAIMMNPGSSEPLDVKMIQRNWKTNIEKTLTLAKPDNTQNQLMAVMDMFGFDYIKILNLSDIRTPKSNVFHSKLKDYSDDHTHSIFSQERTHELLSELGCKNIPVIAGWGLSHEHIYFANLASFTISDRTIIGMKDKEYNLYRHPLPPIHNKQKEWLDYVTSKISIMKRELKKCG